MRVLVTGASGFVGSWVCRELLRRGVAVHAVVSPASKTCRLAGIRDEMTLVEWDLFRSASRAPARIEAPDVCIHCAWYVQPQRYLTALENLEWMHQSVSLFQWLASAGCRRIVGVGTCLEYEPSAEALDERAPLAPKTLYAAAKASTFLAARALLAQLRVSFVWARLFYLFGPGEHPNRLVSGVTLALLGGRKIGVTHGHQVRDFLHVADAAAALAELALHSVEGPINVGSGYPATVREILEHLGRISSRSDLLEFGARPEGLGDPPRILADVRRLRDTTGWSPRFDLRSGLEDTVVWWRQHGCKSPA